jgi:hypothetical protein
MVLHLDERQFLLVRPRGREVTGMQIARHGRRPHAEHLDVEPEVGAEGLVRGVGVEIAEMRREERVATADDAERALQLGARGDNGNGRRER